MVEIEEIKYENTKALAERNQLVDKINEIINIIITNDIESIAPKLALINSELDAMSLLITENRDYTEEEIARVESETDADVSRIDTNFNSLTFVKELLDYVVTSALVKLRVKMRNDDIVEKVFPVVSESQMGMMPPSAYSQIWINRDELASYKNNSLIVTTNVGETVTQEALTLANETVRGRDTIDGDRLLNTYDNLLFIYASGIWYPLSESATPQATNSSLGTVMGSTEPGKTQVEVDGTQSVNNWDIETGKIAQNITDIAKKLNKITTSASYPRVYGVSANGENQEAISYVESAISNTIPIRDINGRLKSLIPASDNDVVNKEYVDNTFTTKVYVDGRVISIANISITSANWIANIDSASLVSRGYLYQYTIPITGMLATMYPIVTPSLTDRISGYLWGWCQSIDGGVTIYSKSATSMNILTVIGMVI